MYVYHTCPLLYSVKILSYIRILSVLRSDEVVYIVFLVEVSYFYKELYRFLQIRCILIGDTNNIIIFRLYA